MLEYGWSELTTGSLLDEELVLTHKLVGACDLIAEVFIWIGAIMLEGKNSAEPIGTRGSGSLLIILDV